MPEPASGITYRVGITPANTRISPVKFASLGYLGFLCSTHCLNPLKLFNVERQSLELASILGCHDRDNVFLKFRRAGQLGLLQAHTIPPKRLVLGC